MSEENNAQRLDCLIAEIRTLRAHVMDMVARMDAFDKNMQRMVPKPLPYPPVCYPPVCLLERRLKPGSKRFCDNARR